ncbi:MAG: preprotein translocase subunit SecE [Anaerolineales bacterium]|nr:preprotein translocase subunit SecE [Anaerolineales bacterium]
MKDQKTKESKNIDQKSTAPKARAQKSAEPKGKEQKTAERRQPNAIQRYFNETVGELRKVSWPTRKEATNLTIIVLVVIFSMSALLGVLDFFFSKIFELLLI